MASSGKATFYLINKLLDHVFGGTVYTPPPTLYYALFTTVPAQDGTGGVEVSGTGYARKAMTDNTTLWPNAVAGVKTSGAQVAFAAPGGSWGTALGYGIYDAASSGNLLTVTTLATGVPISTGDPITINAGDMTITVG